MAVTANTREAACRSVLDRVLGLPALEPRGDVAIGLHDYPYPELGYPTNAELVSRVADLARSMGREVATAAEARDMLGMH